MIKKVDDENILEVNKMIIEKLQDKFKNYEVRKIDENNAKDALKILNNNQYFIKNTQNHEPTLQDVIEDIDGKPPEVLIENKTYCTIYKDNEAILSIDYLEKFPNDNSAYIGLFILDTSQHGKGLAKIFLDGIIEISRELGFSEIQLGCMKKNEIGYKFWSKNGFEVIGEVVHKIDGLDFDIYKMKKCI